MIRRAVFIFSCRMAYKDMQFIDEITIYAKAGDGGNGVVRWLHEKGKEWGGPAGGNGGRGGHVYVRATRNIHLLAKYKAKKEFLAGRGADGENNSRHGEDGEDLYIDLPVGSIVTNKGTGREIYLADEGETALILEGGAGGRGNKTFMNSTNRSPQESTPGQKGEEGEFVVELELIADLGLIGLPNAGKSSLLNELTNARARVGAYPFTTLEPNLGEMEGYIIADIPGLIEGAAEGRGLGHKFLRHIKRTKFLVHLVSLENDDPLLAYKTVREELARFDRELTEKKEIVVLTKTDVLPDGAALKDRVEQMEKNTQAVLAITLYDGEDVKKLRGFLLRELQAETK